MKLAGGWLFLVLGGATTTRFGTFGAPDRVTPEPLRIGAILRSQDDEAQQMINSWMLFVHTVNLHGGLRLSETNQVRLLQFVIVDQAMSSMADMANVSFWIREVQSSPSKGLVISTSSQSGSLENVFSMNNLEEQIFTLLRTLSRKVSTLAVLVETGHEGCNNVSVKAVEVNLSVQVQALEDADLQALKQTNPEALLICASSSSTERFLQAAKFLQYMPLALLVTCPLSELQTLGEDADFLLGVQRQLPSESSSMVRNHSYFVQEYQHRFLQKPSDVAILAYSIAQHLVQAISAAGSADTDVVAVELQGISLDVMQMLQMQAGEAKEVDLGVQGAVFPAPSWADRPCRFTGLQGYGFRAAACGPCNSTEEVVVNHSTGRRQCIACISSNRSACGCQACDCAPGASNETGSCVPCAPGSFAATRGSSSCTLCPPGFISGLGSRSCSACALGYYAPQAGLSECVHCQRGMAANGTGRSQCTSCPAGSFGLMGRCQECNVGSFQAVPGQSSCTEDGPGQRSPKPGMVSPSNAPGYYAIWAASSSEQFAMERCVKEEACLPETCAEGTTGRQCFATLGGFSAGASSRYRCISWQLYMALGILLAVAYLAGYTCFATILATSDGASNELYLMMLKIFLNHCASMSVLLSCFLRAPGVPQGPLLEAFLSITMLTDGVPPCENYIFSLPCLFQPWRTKELRRAFEALGNAAQVDFSSPGLSEARAALASFHSSTETRLLFFWASLPLVASLLPCLLLLFWLRIYMARHSQHWHQAAQFSSKVYFDGLEIVGASYPPEVFDHMLAISTRRLWGLSWPLMHCSAWIHSTPPIRSFLGSLCCCIVSPFLFLPRLSSQLDLMRFWKETAPLRLSLLYFFSFPAARRSFATLQCQQLGDGTMVMYSNGMLACEVSQPLHYFSFMAGLVWMMWPFLCWWELRCRREMVPATQIKRRYGIMLLGYNSSCWRWEVVPISALQKCFLIVCVSLAVMIGHVTMRPFDHRWFHLLNRLEMRHLLVLMISAFLCMISLQSWISPFITVLLVAALQGIYVLASLLSFSCILLASDVSTLKSWEKGCLKRLVKLLLVYKHQQSDSEAYIAYDNVHRYVTVLANVGGQCSLPHLPIGRQLEVVRQKSLAQVRCRLSDVPRHLENFHFVSASQLREVSRELSFTMEYIAKNSVVMSCFLLDFVLRAAFLIGAEDSHRQGAADDGPHEVEKHAWQQANRKRDLLVIASMAEEQGKHDLIGQAWRGGPSIQRELSEEEEVIASWGYLEDAPIKVDVGNELHQGGSLPRPTSPSASVARLVYRMFSPTIFRRGCTLQELKESLLVLRNTPRDELERWLDFFERAWFPEFLDSDKEIHLMSGTRLEGGVQANAKDILKALRRPRRRAELSPEGVPAQCVSCYSTTVVESKPWIWVISCACVCPGLLAS